MKRKNKIKILSLIVILVMLFTTISYGFGINDLKGSKVEGTELTKAGNSIVKVIFTVGVVVSVVMLIVLGIKYMLGSVDEKAEYKRSLLPYIIGAALMFAASTIAQIIYDIAIKI